MQTLIALLAFLVLGVYNLHRVYQPEESLAQNNVRSPETKKTSTQPPSTDQTRNIDNGHIVLWLQFLSEFHKVQCFYSTALQIASFVAIHGKNKNRTDDMFLLFISADGLVPISIVLYTLLILKHTQVYDVVLAGTSALLASITGLSIILGYSSTRIASYGSWPVSCGGQSPHGICEVPTDFKISGNPNLYFAGIAIVLDILITSLILAYCWPRLNSLTGSKILDWPQLISKRAYNITVRTLHCSGVIILLACTAIEGYFFVGVLWPNNLYVLHDWNFGQVVGITIWSAIIVDLIRHELGK